MQSRLYRLREFIRPADGRSLVVDTSAGLSLGALPGLEDYAAAVAPLLPLADGVVASPGMSRRLGMRTRQDAALLIRADWTNALRGPDFVLPPEKIGHLALLDPADALDLGAAALVATFLLGYEEAIDAACLRNTVQLAIAGAQVGLPLLLDVVPTGPRVRTLNKAIELGVSYALEGGAEGAVIPWPGEQSMATIVTMAGGTPVWVRVAPQDVDTLRRALDLGAAGAWLGADLFTLPDPPGAAAALAAVVHSGGAA
jgi:DhnA family fructose-bisphosphate aldolase class Ia